jgi:hypothetical protein
MLYGREERVAFDDVECAPVVPHPAFGGPDDRLRVPALRLNRVGTALRAFAHPAQRSRTTQFVPARLLAE